MLRHCFLKVTVQICQYSLGYWSAGANTPTVWADHQTADDTMLSLTYWRKLKIKNYPVRTRYSVWQLQRFSCAKQLDDHGSHVVLTPILLAVVW